MTQRGREICGALSSPMKPKPLCRPEVGSLANIQDLIRPKASNTLLMSSSDRSGWTDATYIRLKARASSASWSMMGCAWPMLLGRPTYSTDQTSNATEERVWWTNHDRSPSRLRAESQRFTSNPRKRGETSSSWLSVEARFITMTQRIENLRGHHSIGSDAEK